MLTVQDSIKHLEDKGYLKHFTIKEGQLFDASSNSFIASDTMKVDEIYRVDEESGGGGQSIIYALSSKQTSANSKGLLISGYGRFAEPEESRVLELLDDCHQKSDQS